jgi:hypothetical protein
MCFSIYKTHVESGIPYIYNLLNGAKYKNNKNNYRSISYAFAVYFNLSKGVYIPTQLVLVYLNLLKML